VLFLTFCNIDLAGLSGAVTVSLPVTTPCRASAGRPSLCGRAIGKNVRRCRGQAAAALLLACPMLLPCSQTHHGILITGAVRTLPALLPEDADETTALAGAAAFCRLPAFCVARRALSVVNVAISYFRFLLPRGFQRFCLFEPVLPFLPAKPGNTAVYCLTNSQDL